MGVNKVTLLGNLGADPEHRYTPNGASVCEFRLATNERWLDKQGQKQERTEWHRIVAWGKLADICAEYLSKGRQVYLEGKLRTRSWTDKESTKRWMTEVIADKVEFLGGGGEKRAAKSERTADEVIDDLDGSDAPDFGDTDIPF